ncbi:MAG: F0F1 ATP synthase subunit gamma [Methylacidiphilales bacterium]|nr:F0F1 ATP synthase subunit gamma [Candidatus Methylacidiphilales bacterium]
MAGGKEIRTKIKSVKNTQKITKAMEMVAASKMSKAQLRMSMARPFAEKIKEVAIHISTANPEYKHPFLSHKKTVSNKIGIILMSTDRGLCGGLNSNLFRNLFKFTQALHLNTSDCHVAVIGNKGGAVCRRLGMQVNAQVTGLGDIPDPEKIVGLVHSISDLFVQEKVDRVYLASNKFTNTVSQTPWIRTLLPFTLLHDSESGSVANPQLASKLPWDYIYEPKAKNILAMLMPMYLRSIVYQALLENISCEMASRMVAMKNATDNAKSLIEELQLKYNKIRQASITQEISEIVAGASAV